MLCYDYFSENIKETEVDSMLLSDTTELLKAEPSTASAAVLCAHNEILKTSALAQKISAWLILLLKYTNANEAVTGFCTKQACYPVYAEINSVEQSGAVTEHIEKWIKDVSGLEDIDTFDLNTFINELELQPMPMLYSDESLFDNAFVGDGGMKLAALLKDNSITASSTNT